MVGVAGKSKGCKTCRKRKIRCDQTRPSCGQCQRSKRTCGGYDKATTFLNHYAGTFGEAPGAVSRTHADSRFSTWLNWQCGLYSPQSALGRLPGLSRIESSQVFAHFVESALPKRPTRREVPLSWVVDIADLTHEADALAHAGAAIGHGWLGHNHLVSNEVDIGKQCYAASLSSLRASLEDRDRMTPRRQLTAMALLLLYEMAEFGTSENRGWVTHASGIEAVLVQATPQTFVTGLNHKLFLFCRAVIILKSLLLGHRTVLCESEWHHTPWSMHSKSSFHKLLDLAAETTTIVAGLDSIGASTAAGENSNVNLVTKAAKLNDHLSRWEQECHVHLPDDPPSTVESPRRCRFPDDMLNSSLHRHWYPCRAPDEVDAHFLLVQKSRLMLFYWAVKLNLQTHVLRKEQLRHGLAALLKQQPLNQGVRSIPEEKGPAIDSEEATFCADKITSWFRFVVQQAWQSFGSSFGTFCLRSAISWYECLEEGLCREEVSNDMHLRKAQLEQCQRMLQDMVELGSPPPRAL